MATRSVIILQSKKENKTIALYKHYDGYPTNTMLLLVDTIGKLSIINQETTSNVSLLLSKEIGQASETVKYSSEYSDLPFNNSDYTKNGDIEYLYIVDLDNSNIDIFGNDIGSESDLFQKGKTSMLLEVESYKEEYKTEAKEIIKGIEEKAEFYNISINQGKEAEKDDLIKTIKNLQDEKRELESKLYSKENEIEKFYKNSNIINETMQKVSSQVIKSILEAYLNIKIKKVTKTSEGFNVYIDDNQEWKKEDHNYNTIWQEIRKASYIFSIKLEMKRL